MFRLNEPISMLTDYLVGAFSLGLARRLQDQARDPDSPAIRAWDGALKSLAAASFFGGTEHGFRPVVGKRRQRLLWKGVILSLGLTGYHLLRAAIETFIRRERRPALTRLAQAETATYEAWVTLGDDDYTWGIAQYGIGMAALAAGATPRALKGCTALRRSSPSPRRLACPASLVRWARVLSAAQRGCTWWWRKPISPPANSSARCFCKATPPPATMRT